MKNIALIIGKKNSVGLPGKNLQMLCGRPSAEYAFLATQKSRKIDTVFVSSDCEEILNIGQAYGANLIFRPTALSSANTLTEDVLSHAYGEISKEICVSDIATISLLLCNAPAIDVALLDEAITFLEQDRQNYDSCFSVVRYDMFSPSRARVLGPSGEILPALAESLQKVSSLRDSSGPIYFCDLSIQVMKPHCLSDILNGFLPFRWQGKKSKAIHTDYGFDIDNAWQSVVIERWLQERGLGKSV